MILYPAIDIYEGKAVRLYKGDYDQMTVYSGYPAKIAEDFIRAGATHIHTVDLEGARDGGTPNFETISAIKAAAEAACRKNGFSSFVETGGGIRDEAAIEKYLEAGIDRVILGTAAVRDPQFLKRAARTYGEKIAVGIDVKDGCVAVKGWTELSEYTLERFAALMQDEGIYTIICTDISRDGAMRGTNREMYRRLSDSFGMDIIASGGVSAIEDIESLAAMGMHGAIIGKAYYTGAIDLTEAIRAAGVQTDSKPAD